MEHGSKHKVMCQEYRNTVFRSAVRKTNAQMEINQAKDVKDKKKGFSKYIGDKKTRADVITRPFLTIFDRS